VSTDPESGPGGGSGGFAPARNVGQAQLDFSQAGGAPALAIFALGSGDSEMIDLTTPTAPEPVVAGTYAYTLALQQDGGGVLAPWHAELVIDDDWYSLPLYAVTGEAVTQYPTALSSAWYSDAGSPFRVALYGDAGDTFTGKLYVQRLA
jgi:hypothetical protein